MPAPNPVSDLRRVSALGIIDQKTGLPAWASGDLPVVRRAGEAAVRLYEDRAQLEEAVAKAQGNEELTAAGKAARARQAATTFAKVDIALVRGARDAMAAEIERARSTLSIPAPEGDKVVVAIRAQEIRSELRGLSQLEVDTAALEAAERGEGETLHALLNPPGRSLVSKDGAARAREAFLGSARADDLARVTRLESALRQLDGLIASAQRRALQLGADGVGPILGEPPLSTVDPEKDLMGLAGITANTAA